MHKVGLHPMSSRQLWARSDRPAARLGDPGLQPRLRCVSPVRTCQGPQVVAGDPLEPHACGFRVGGAGRSCPPVSPQGRLPGCGWEEGALPVPRAEKR